MPVRISSGGPARSVGWLHYRYTWYILFLVLMLYKLVWMHTNLQLANMNMDRADYIIAVGSLLLVSFWTLWLPPKGRLAALTLLNLALTGLIYADLVFYRYFDDFITVPVLMQAGQVSSLGGSIGTLLEPGDILFFLDWILVIPVAIMILFRRKKNPRLSVGYDSPVDRRRRRHRRLARAAAGTAVLILGGCMTFFPIQKASDTWAKGLFAGNWWNVTLYNVTGLIAFHGYDMYRYSRDHLVGQPGLSEEQIAEVKQWLDGRRSNRTQLNDLFGKYRGSNVMMIQTEALMNAVIGQNVNGQEITPNLNKLMEESLYYSQFYHQTALGRTSDADFVTQSSLLPLSAGSVFTRYPDRGYDVLPKILKEHGYAANVFHAYESSFWNRQTVYAAMDYDRFFSKKDYELTETLGWSLSDKAFFSQSLEMMSGIQQPFYSFLITLTSHHPYRLPEPHRKLDTGELEGTMLGDYLNSIHYVDEAFGELIEQMKQQGLWDNTILIIYGDHDNSIKDQSAYEQWLGRELSELDMEQMMNQVPLLIRLPDGAHGGTIDPEAAGMMNVAPSILHLLGISSEPYYWIGTSLFDERDRLIPLRSGAFSSKDVYYLPSESRAFEEGTCYSLESRQPTAVAACREGYDEAQTMLEVSDNVILYHLLPQFRSNGQPSDQGHAAK